MKITRSCFYLSVALLILLTGCAPASTTATPAPPLAVVEPATQEVTEAPPAGEAPPEATASPTAVNLIGPPMEVGSTYLYFDGATLVAVPGGPFLMGHGGSDNPVHEVSLGDFWIYRTKVTNQQYADCVNHGQCTPPDLTDNRVYNDPLQFNDPVVGVTWTQADAYCKYVHGFLPTEAQWEKTARGPKEVANLYPWGNGAPSCDLLNYNNCIGETTHVTKYPQGRSYYEALELSGNAYEWVADWYDAYYYRNGPAQDPLGPELGNVRSVRSSSFRSNNDQVPASVRFFANPEEHSRERGFRCVVNDPTYFAPMCQVTSYVGPDLSGNTPNLNIQTFCPSLSASPAQLQCGTGVTIITFAVEPASDPYVSFNAPGCTLISDDVVGSKRVVKYQCINQYGVATISSKCTYKGSFTASCPAHYVLDDATKSCNWDGSGTEGTACPAGYEYDPVNKCCTSTAGAGKDVPACPAGSSFVDLGGGAFACFAVGIFGDTPPKSADMTPPASCPPPPGSQCDPATDPSCKPCDPKTDPNCPGGKPDQPGGQCPPGETLHCSPSGGQCYCSK